MRGHAWRVTELLLLPTIALAIAAALAPGRRELELRLWLLVVLALARVTLVGAARALYPPAPSPFRASLRRRVAGVQRPEALVRLEREVAMAGSSGFDVRHRLRPVLTELVQSLLAARRGIDLEREPERARAVIGEDAWMLVDPDQPPAADRRSEAIDVDRLERAVSALERV
jgi:hypothetical protein